MNNKIFPFLNNLKIKNCKSKKNPNKTIIINNK